MPLPDIHNFLKRIAGNITGVWKREGYGSQISFKNNLGSGYIKGMAIDKEILAIVNEIALEKPIYFTSFTEARYFKLSFYLEGEFEHKNFSSGISNRINKGICRISVFNAPGRNCIQNINGRIKSLDLILGQSLFRSALVLLPEGSVKERLSCMTRTSKNDSFVAYLSADIFRKAEVIINAVLSKPYCNILKVRSLVLELLSELVSYATKHDRIENTQYILTETDRLKLFQAKEYLDKNLVEPPTLKELSKIVGLNEFKLKRGFKSVFKTTVHSYSVDLRLCQSCILLRKSDCLVSEVCYGVGYHCPSKFIRLFRKKFGITPGQFRKGHQGFLK